MTLITGLHNFNNQWGNTIPSPLKLNSDMASKSVSIISVVLDSSFFLCECIHMDDKGRLKRKSEANKIMPHVFSVFSFS